MIAAVGKALSGFNWNKLNFWLWFWVAFLVAFLIGQYTGGKRVEASQKEVQIQQQKKDFEGAIEIYRNIPDSADIDYWTWLRSR